MLSKICCDYLIGQLQAMAALTHPNMPLGQQQILGTQTPTIIGNQPLYIRAAAPGPIPTQQGIVGMWLVVEMKKGNIEIYITHCH